MALETGTYLSDLVVTNPAHSDGLNATDAHLRLIKAALKSTFPNLTGAVTATQDAINGYAASITALQATVNTNGVSRLAHAGTFFDNGAGAASTDGFQNTLAGDIDVVLQGTVGATFQRAGGVNFFKLTGQAQITGGLTATQEIKGPGVPQPGSTMIWWDDVLPSDGLWAFCNGQVIANANVVAPILLARWGNRFGGNGTTTMGLPDLRETVPMGKSTMGGASSRGNYGSSLPGFANINTINLVVGEAMHTNTASEMPVHYHAVGISDPGHAHSGNLNGQALGAGAGGVQWYGGPVGVTNSITINAATTGIRVSGPNGIDQSYSAGGGGAHNNTQLSTICNWIIRIG